MTDQEARVQIVHQTSVLGKIALALGCAVLTGVLVIVLYLIPVARNINATSAGILVCRYQDTAGIWHGNPNCAESLFASIGGSIRTASGATAKAAPEIAQSVKEMAQSLRDTSQESVRTSKQGTVVLTEVTGAVGDLRGVLSEVGTSVSSIDVLVKDMDVSINKGTLPALTDDLTKIGRTLDQLSKEGGLLSETTGTIHAARATVDQLNTIVSSQDLVETRRNLNSMTAHLDGAASNAERGLGYVSDSLKPTHLSFWQTVENAAFSSIPGGLVQFFLHWKPQRVQEVNPR